MPSTITPTTLKVTITEDIILNGQPINSLNELEIRNVDEVDKRIMTLPQGAEVSILSFGAQVSSGTIVRGNMKYFRVTNLDSVNYARIRMYKIGADAFDVQLDAGKSFMVGNTDLNVSKTGVAFATYVDADIISGEAYDGDIDIEYFVAST